VGEPNRIEGRLHKNDTELWRALLDPLPSGAFVGLAGCCTAKGGVRQDNLLAAAHAIRPDLWVQGSRVPAAIGPFHTGPVGELLGLNLLAPPRCLVSVGGSGGSI
jgi:hypothetical protein